MLTITSPAGLAGAHAAQSLAVVQAGGRGAGRHRGQVSKVIGPFASLTLPIRLRGFRTPATNCSVALLLALPLMGDPLTSMGKRLGAAFRGGSGGDDAQAVMTGSTLALRTPAAEPESDLPGAYRITPERRALLNTIRYAEGTWVGGSSEGYRILYGGGRFESLERHPEIVVRKRYVSAAAGAYQFLPATWREAAQRLGLADFTAPNQDQAALYLVEKRGALASFDRHGLTAEVLSRLAHEWASLPNLAGASAYGQPVKALEELQRFYGRELARQRGTSSDRMPLV